MHPVFADMAVWPIFVVGGGILVGGILAANGLVWLSFWLARRRQRKAEPASEETQ